MTNTNKPTRRHFCKCVASTLLTTTLPKIAMSQDQSSRKFQLRYLLSSAMYGTTELKHILPAAAKVGAKAIDIWPRPHGNQYEQVQEMGTEKFAKMLREQKLNLGAISCYKFGPFSLQKEMKLASKLAGKETLFVCGGRGPKDLSGAALKSAVRKFAEQMKPHIEVAEKYQYVIAVENHANNLIDSPDSCKWLVEFTNSKHLGIAVAPHHLEPLGLNARQMAEFIIDLGEHIALFYAQQHGSGSSKKLPKEQELLQMPGRGKLDFAPLVEALEKIDYQGYTEIFMHPVPRGVPILETPELITQEINRSRKYLEGLVS